MPNNFRIFENNLCLGTAATVTVNTAVTTMPGTHILNDNRNKVWRTTGTIGTSVIDLGAAYAVNGVGFISSNMGTSGTFTVQANSADSWGAPAYNSGGTNPYDDTYTGVILHYPASLQTYRYWRIILNNPGQSYVELGALWLGTYVAFERNFLYGWELNENALSRTEYVIGHPYTYGYPSYKEASLSVRHLTESWVWGTLMPMMSRAAGKQEMLLALMPQRTAAEGTATEHALNLYGRIFSPRVVNDRYLVYTWSALFRESL